MITTAIQAQIVKDSTWHYGGWEVHPDWDLERKTYYTYNSDAQIIHEISYSILVEPATNFAKKDYFYNEDNLLSKIESYLWLPESNEWKIINENYYEYDAANRIIKDETWAYNTFDNDVFKFRDEYAYNEFGNQTYWAYVSWSPGWDWVPEVQSSYAYDANQNLLTVSSSSGAGNELTTYTYDELDRRLTRNAQNQDSYETYIYPRQTYFYTGDQLIPDSMFTESYEPYTAVWSNSVMNHYSYDANDNLLEDLKLQWNIAEANWQNSSLKNYTYDSQNNETEFILQNHNTSTWQNQSRRANAFNSLGLSLDEYKNQAWNVDDLQWYEGANYLNEYDEDGYLLEEITLDWDAETWDYRNLFKDVHFWSAFVFVNNNEQFQRSENWTFQNPYPIGSPIVLEDFNPNEIYQFKGYDLTGKLIHSESFTGSQNLRLNHQMASGNYVFLVSDRDNNILVKQVFVF
jgi:hypothetical protein